MRKTIDIDESILTKNPFVEALNIDVTKVINSTQYKPDLSGKFNPVTYYIERDQSTKIYRDLDAKRAISQLSSAGQRMYLYILYNIEPGKDFIFINRQRYMSMNNITSINTVKKGIKELLKYGIIDDSDEYQHYVYWINPAIFFAGSRTLKYPDKIQIKGTQTR